MPNLKEVRTRIASVISTQQITSAMKMVAASKLRRAQNAIINLRPYASKLREMMGNLSADAGETDAAAYAVDRKPEKILLIAIASNRGLCGAFNANVIKATSELIHVRYSSQYKNGNVHIIAIGKKVSDFFNRRKYPVIGSYNTVFDGLTFDKVLPIAEMVMKDFLEKKYDRVEIIYNQFKNAAVQRLIVEQFLPLVPQEKKAGSQVQATDYLYEPSREEILNDLIPRSLKIQLYKTVLDSFASEHGARMTAMHKATDNASELLRELKLSYNKARQAAITNEILEIVSGAEALKG
ncbi:MAG: ATP synthase F1 subunit gamma [Bacteroidetes bacterium]|nr:ATP synthase F1 subunit gamma [Bacteroidota bacterium]